MTPLRVLHVEDEPNARAMLADLIGDDVDLHSVPSAEAALDTLQQRRFDLTILDWTLPGASGGAVLDADSPNAGRVVVLTALGTFDRAVHALRSGAYDFLVKPVDPPALFALLDRVRHSQTLIAHAEHSAPTVHTSPAADSILGSSPQVEDLKDRLARVARSSATVLIVGESGTGKELVARALHQASNRHHARLVTVNCAAIPEPLFESEVFGHAKGAFTGAHQAHAGLLELAHHGTLFLDEIGELALPHQAKLLRTLQEGTLRRVGETHDRPVDLRVIAATHRDLDVEVDRGTFREDLLYRLDVIRLEPPPLRQRLHDLPLLLDHFLARTSTRYEQPTPTLSPSHLDALRAHPWPGNIRELQNVVQRIVLLGPDLALQELNRRRPPRDTPDDDTPDTPDDEDVTTLKHAVAHATRRAILRALHATQGNRTAAAALLGVSRKTLFNKMTELGIKQESNWT